MSPGLFQAPCDRLKHALGLAAQRVEPYRTLEHIIARAAIFSFIVRIPFSEVEHPDSAPTPFFQRPEPYKMARSVPSVLLIIDRKPAMERVAADQAVFRADPLSARMERRDGRGAGRHRRPQKPVEQGPVPRRLETVRDAGAPVLVALGCDELAESNRGLFRVPAENDLAELGGESAFARQNGLDELLVG